MSQLLGVWTLTAALMALSACNRSGWDYWDQPDDPPVAVPSDDSPRVTMEIPHPINLLLPQRIDIHPFTRAQPTEANARGGGVLEGNMMTLLHRVVFYGDHLQSARHLADLMNMRVVEEG